MSDSRQPLSVFREGSAEFESKLKALSRRGDTDLDRVETVVRGIVGDVRAQGDMALVGYIKKFENRDVTRPFIRDYAGEAALQSLAPEMQQALALAAERIREYHEHQAQQQKTFSYRKDGITLGSRVTPLARVGVYAPGGKACYPSSVLMSVIPAKVAGVEEIFVASPDTRPEVRAACHLAEVSAIVDAGGAHAIAAMAYGTETVPQVDKIVGPGNLYVAAAKRLVFGEVDIDSIAGPSEILVIADDSANPAFIAADLLSQAEHDQDAYALFLTTSEQLLTAVQSAVTQQLAALPDRDGSGHARRSVAEASLAAHGTALLVKDRASLARVANSLAAEHISLQTEEPRALADHILRAGALFIGHQTPEAAGDYLAGPSHVLPTGGAARYAAPLGTYDFVSRSSLIEYDNSSLAAQSQAISTFARAEGLEAHARAVEIRALQK